MLINLKNNYMIDYMEFKTEIYVVFIEEGGLTLAGN